MILLHQRTLTDTLAFVLEGRNYLYLSGLPTIQTSFRRSSRTKMVNIPALKIFRNTRDLWRYFPTVTEKLSKNLMVLNLNWKCQYKFTTCHTYTFPHPAVPCMTKLVSLSSSDSDPKIHLSLQETEASWKNG